MLYQLLPGWEKRELLITTLRSERQGKASQEKSPRLGVLRLDLQPSPCAQAIIDISQSITYQFASHKPPLIIMETSELEITALRPGMVV